MGLSKWVALRTAIKMLIPKKDRVMIYEYLFKEGVLVAKKDPFAAKHPEIECKNLHVMKALTSLKSKGFVREQFAWRHYYWYLTNEGIQYLREFLHLPAEIVPATLKRQTRTEAPRPMRPRTDQEAHPELQVPLTVLSTERLAHLALVIRNLKLVLDPKETLNSVEVTAEDVVDSVVLVALLEDSKTLGNNGGINNTH